MGDVIRRDGLLDHARRVGFAMGFGLLTSWRSRAGISP
jgi:hypothetical protein